jgi:hypothetical protein
MPSTNINASAERAGWLSQTWEKVATVLAVIGLIDVSSQLIKWASLIHWVAEHYAAVRTWLFGWLPFHIPKEWHDPIVLLLIFFSVVNVGVYQRTGHTIISFWRKPYKPGDIRLDDYFVGMDFPAGMIAIIAGFMGFFYTVKILSMIDNSPIHGFIDIVVRIPLLIIPITIGILIAMLSIVMFAFARVAWRWLLTTAAIFVALVAINYAYVQWLEPLAEHH